MSNPMYGSNKADNFQNKQVMVVDSPALSSAGTVYAVAPWKCKVLEVRWVMNVALTTAKSTLTLKSSAGTMGGTHEIAASSAIGASGVVSPTSNNIIVKEHKRNVNILKGVLLMIGTTTLKPHGLVIIKKHLHNLNKYHSHISFGMFSSLSIVKQYKLNVIQLEVLYNHLLFNSYLK